MSTPLIDNIFKVIDNDNSGSITKQEMHDVFKKIDKDGSGNIDKEEWLEGFVKLFAATPVLAIKIFEHLDGDKSGDISMAEIDNLFAKMDADKSGSVDKDEFTAVFQKLLG